MAAVGTRYYTPNPFEFNENGIPLAGGQLFFFASGTDTPQATYSDVELTTPNTNPVVADANGRFGTIFMIPSNAYKVQMLDADDVQVWTEDPCGPAAGGAATNTIGIIGEVRDFAGPAAAIPAGWLLCYGQAVSRTTYAALFAVIGTTWGAGDASTTFNVPDARGRASFGLDNMGGVGAGRVTAGVSGIPGTTLGGVGGDQNAQEDTISVSGSATSTVTDPGHVHTERAGQGTGGSSSAWNLQSASGVAAGLVNLQVTSSKTDITVATTLTGVSAVSSLTGSSQNMPPAAMFNKMIYTGA